MNGIHDMGGMHGMGPIQPERIEPVSREVWERILSTLIYGTITLCQLDSAARFGKSRRAQRKGEHA